ncbi:hypothetical protein FB451DRAFT_1399018 [Mycena latifolia]|nr:hypothetical protein FB451DRAFT_1399018 [Mycena latifolia]
MSSTKEYDADNSKGAGNWSGPWFLIHWGLITRNETCAFDVQETDGPFKAILKFLPRCYGFQHVFTRTEAGNFKQIRPLFYVVEGSLKVWDNQEDTETAYYAQGHKNAGIYVTDSRDDAEEYTKNEVWIEDVA